MLNVPVNQIGAPAIVVIVVLMILLGYLVPKRSVTRLEKDRDAWMEATFSTQKVVVEKDKQIAELLKTAETTRKVLDAVAPPLESTQHEVTTISPPHSTVQ